MATTAKKKPLKLYTKTGDKGQSNVLSGVRTPKHHALFDLLGTIDELNSWVGHCVTQVEDKNLKTELNQIQTNLLTCGALVAGSNKVNLNSNAVDVLESRIDYYQANTADEWYKKFLLPGGSELSSRIDITRTVCRRCERVASFYAQSDDHNHYTNETDLVVIQQYLNRLSDYLFALRCYVNSVVGYKETKFNE